MNQQFAKLAVLTALFIQGAVMQSSFAATTTPGGLFDLTELSHLTSGNTVQVAAKCGAGSCGGKTDAKKGEAHSCGAKKDGAHSCAAKKDGEAHSCAAKDGAHEGDAKKPAPAHH